MEQNINLQGNDIEEQEVNLEEMEPQADDLQGISEDEIDWTVEYDETLKDDSDDFREEEE